MSERKRNTAVEPVRELTPRSVDWTRVLRLLAFFGIAALVVISLVFVYESLMIPVSVAAFLTYLLLPLVEQLERRRVRRVYAVSGLLLLSLAAIGLGIVRLVPEVYRQAMSLVRLTPGAMSAVLDVWVPLAEKFVVDLGVMDATDVHAWFSTSSLLGRLNSQLEAGLRGLWNTGTSVLGGMLNIVLIPLLTFFMLNDYDHVERSLSRLVPRDLVAPVSIVMDKVNLTLRSVLKGQVTVAGILAVLYVIGLSAVGLQQAVAIGVVAGICRLIPYLDVVVGGALSVIVLLSDFQGWGQVLSVVLVFLIVQAIDGVLITPRVVGERVGLHPVVVIASVLAFADWLGFWGILIAVPVVAIFKALLVTARPFYLASGLYDPTHCSPHPSGQSEPSK
jgi:predicted PurR-regulated permease PerM